MFQYLWAIFRMNIKQLGALRASSFLQIIFMLLNNLVFFVFWIIIYSHVDSIRGLRLEHIAFLFAVTAAAFGLCAIFCGGCLRIADKIEQGQLEVYLTQPPDVQLQVLCSHTMLSGWGDFLTAFVMLGFYFGLDYYVWLVLFISSLIGALLFVASFSIIQSLIFWIPHCQRLCEQGTEFMLTFALYPNKIFSGPVKALTFTLIPAGYISYLPVLAIQQHTLLWVFVSGIAAIFYFYLSRLIFRAGLKRYESGSMFV